MSKVIRLLTALALIASLGMAVTGCEKEKGPLEKAGEKADGFFKKAGDAARGAADKAKKELDK